MRMETVISYISLALLVYLSYTAYMRSEPFVNAASPCPSFCRNAGNMHPVCVEGRKMGRANCGTGGHV